MEGCVSIFIPGIDISFTVDKMLKNFEIAISCSIIERGVAFSISSIYISFGQSVLVLLKVVKVVFLARFKHILLSDREFVLHENCGKSGPSFEFLLQAQQTLVLINPRIQPFEKHFCLFLRFLVR